MKSNTKKPVVNVFKKTILARSIAAATASLAALSSQAAPVAEVDSGVNVLTVGGVPVVEIVAPSAQGLSHNKFTNYNVGPEGLVLNNSITNGASQLAGALSANSNFRGIAADTILAEVTGAQASKLEGQQEIFGQTAEFVLANPNGISVNGAKFLNSSRTTLAVGVAGVVDGELKTLGTGSASGALTVSGAVTAEGSLALLAPTISTATGSSITTGDNFTLDVAAGQALFDSRSVRILGVSEAIKEVKVDAQLFGAMNAGRINVVTTREGAGINLTGDLTAKRSVVVETEGNLTLGGKHTVEQSATASTSQVIRNLASYDAKNITGNNFSVDTKDGVMLVASNDISLTGGALKTGAGTTSISPTSNGAFIMLDSGGNQLLSNVDLTAQMMSAVADGSITFKDIDAFTTKYDKISESDMLLLDALGNINLTNVKTTGTLGVSAGSVVGDAAIGNLSVNNISAGAGMILDAEADFSRTGMVKSGGDMVIGSGTTAEEVAATPEALAAMTAKAAAVAAAKAATAAENNIATKANEAAAAVTARNDAITAAVTAGKAVATTQAAVDAAENDAVIAVNIKDAAEAAFRAAETDEDPDALINAASVYAEAKAAADAATALIEQTKSAAATAVDNKNKADAAVVTAKAVETAAAAAKVNADADAVMAKAASAVATDKADKAAAVAAKITPFTAKAITVDTNLDAGGLLTIASTGDITFGGYKSTGKLSLASDKAVNLGNYVNVASLEVQSRNGFSFAGANIYTKDKLELRTDGNLFVYQSSIRSDGDLILDIDGTVNVTGAATQYWNSGTWNENYRHDVTGRSCFGFIFYWCGDNTRDSYDAVTVKNTNWVGSSISAGKDLAIIDADSISVTGSNVYSGNNGYYVTDKGNINLSYGVSYATREVTTYITDRTWTGKESSSTNNSWSSSSSITPTNVSAKADLKLISAGSITVAGSNVTAGNALSLKAVDDIVFDAAQAISSSHEERSTSTGGSTSGGLFGLRRTTYSVESSTTIDTSQTTNVGSNVTGGSVDIQAGGTFTSNGSNVTATNGNLIIDAKGGIYNNAVYDTRSANIEASETRQSKSKWWFIPVGFSNQSSTASISQSSSTAVVNNFTATGDITLSSEGAIRDEASSIVAGGAVNISGASFTQVQVNNTTTASAHIEQYGQEFYIALNFGQNNNHLDYGSFLDALKTDIEKAGATKVLNAVEKARLKDLTVESDKLIQIHFNADDATTDYKLTQSLGQAGTIKGSEVNINTTGSISLEGTKITATNGDVSLIAGGDINYTATTSDTKESFEQTVMQIGLDAGIGINLFGLSLEADGQAGANFSYDKSSSAAHTENAGSITSGLNTNIDASGQVVLIGTNINSGKNVLITGNQGVTLGATQNASSSQNISAGLSLDADFAAHMPLLSDITIDLNATINGHLSGGFSNKTSQEGVNIQAGNDVLIQSLQGGATLVGTDIDAGRNVNIDAATGITYNPTLNTEMSVGLDATLKADLNVGIRIDPLLVVGINLLTGGSIFDNIHPSISLTGDIDAGLGVRVISDQDGGHINAGNNVSLVTDGIAALMGTEVNAGGNILISGAQGVGLGVASDTSVIVNGGLHIDIAGFDAASTHDIELGLSGGLNGTVAIVQNETQLHAGGNVTLISDQGGVGLLGSEISGENVFISGEKGVISQANRDITGTINASIGGDIGIDFNHFDFGIGGVGIGFGGGIQLIVDDITAELGIGITGNIGIGANINANIDADGTKIDATKVDIISGSGAVQLTAPNITSDTNINIQGATGTTIDSATDINAKINAGITVGIDGQIDIGVAIDNIILDVFSLNTNINGTTVDVDAAIGIDVGLSGQAAIDMIADGGSLNANNININSGGAVSLISTDINAVNEVNISGSSVNYGSGTDTHINATFNGSIPIDIGIDGLIDIPNIGVDIDVLDHLGVDVTIPEINVDLPININVGVNIGASGTMNSIQSGGTINAGSDVNIDSFSSDISLTNTTINTPNGDINLNAAGSINILPGAATNTQFVVGVNGSIPVNIDIGAEIRDLNAGWTSDNGGNFFDGFYASVGSIGVDVGVTAHANANVALNSHSVSTYDPADLTSGGNINLTAGSSVSLTKPNLNATGDVNIDAGTDVTVSATKTTIVDSSLNLGIDADINADIDMNFNNGIGIAFGLGVNNAQINVSTSTSSSQQVESGGKINGNNVNISTAGIVSLESAAINGTNEVNIASTLIEKKNTEIAAVSGGDITAVSNYNGTLIGVYGSVNISSGGLQIGDLGFDTNLGDPQISSTPATPTVKVINMVSDTSTINGTSAGAVRPTGAADGSLAAALHDVRISYINPIQVLTAQRMAALVMLNQQQAMARAAQALVIQNATTEEKRNEERMKLANLLVEQAQVRADKLKYYADELAKLDEQRTAALQDVRASYH